MTRTTNEVTYADASALVKLLLTEPESAELRKAVGARPAFVTSHLAVVEVHRATRVANPSPEMASRTRQLLSSCLLVRVSDEVIARARDAASARLRTLDATHLASALHVGARRFVSYDHRLITAAAAHGLVVSHPGLEL